MERKYLILPLLITLASTLFADEENKRSAPIEQIECLSLSEHYGRAMESMRQQNWNDLIHHCRKVKQFYPASHLADELSYYLALGFYNRGDYQTADRYFTTYLKTQASPKFFEETIRYKFEIAKNFEAGAKKHLFGVKKLPQWLPAQDEAMRIYDEVITTLPNHEIAAEALYRKASLLLKFADYKESIDSFQTLIRRFPKHPLAASSYLGVASVFLQQCQTKFPDPDSLDLAEINLRKFRRDFPGEPRIDQAESMLSGMKERFAEELFEMGKYYEKTKKGDSAAIYYSTIILRYPGTRQAGLSEKRLKLMGRDIPQEGMVAMPEDGDEPHA